jgi:hypothetical protein
MKDASVQMLDMWKRALRNLVAKLLPRGVPELRRNDPCHCGSGRKYKRCCLAKDAETLRDRRANAAAAAGNDFGGRATIAGRALEAANRYRRPKG